MKKVKKDIKQFIKEDFVGQFLTTATMTHHDQCDLLEKYLINGIVSIIDKDIQDYKKNNYILSGNKQYALIVGGVVLNEKYETRQEAEIALKEIFKPHQQPQVKIIYGEKIKKE